MNSYHYGNYVYEFDSVRSPHNLIYGHLQDYDNTNGIGYYKWRENNLNRMSQISNISQSDIYRDYKPNF